MAPTASAHAAVVDAIYATVAEPARWPETLTRLADHVGATGGMLAYHGFGGPGAEHALVVGRLRDDLTRLYLERYAENPYALKLARLPPGQHLASRIVDPAQVRRTAFHADILAPQAIADIVVLVHPSLNRRGSTGGVGFTLDARQAEDRGTAAARLGELAPHIDRAIDLAMELGRSSAPDPPLASLLGALPSAAALVDKRGCVVQVNAAAEALLAKADGLFIRNGDGLRLRAGTATETRRLDHLLAEAVAAGGTGGSPGAHRVTRPSGATAFLVLVTPLPPPVFPLWAAVERGARALVQIVDPHAPVSAQAEVLRAAAGLTAGEARVAGLIGEGLTAPEVASVLSLAPTTVRTHLARCFDKTGARSQAALTRLLASLPAGTPER